ncbi:MAG: DNA-binding protein [Candidatus Aenigmatarchaeota archaeon]
MKALLDTNFLMIPVEFRVDIISGLMSLGYIEIFTLDLVVAELEKFSVKGGKIAKASRVALQIVRNSGVVVLQTKGDLKRVDDEILRLAKTNGYAVCTQDQELLQTAKAAGLRCITLRQKRYLVETGDY